MIITLTSFFDVGTDDEKKHNFFKQIKQLNSGYPGGLSSYISNAKDLLKKSKEGANPFEGAHSLSFFVLFDHTRSSSLIFPNSLFFR